MITSSCLLLASFLEYNRKASQKIFQPSVGRFDIKKPYASLSAKSMSSYPEPVPVAEGLEVVEYYAPTSNRKMERPPEEQERRNQPPADQTAYKLVSEKQSPQNECSNNAVHEETTGQSNGEKKILGFKRKNFLIVVGSSCGLIIIAVLIGTLAGVLVRNRHPSPDSIPSSTSG
jgi:hypothetical protein